MVSTRVATAEELARHLLEISEDRSTIRCLWTRQAGEVAELWVITEPIDFETEKRLHGIGRMLYEKFPSTLFDLRILNPRLSDSPDLVSLVPRDAKPFNIH